MSGSVYKLPEGEFLGGTSLRAPDRLAGTVQFLTPDRVRIYVLRYSKEPPEGLHLEILEFDAAAKVLETVGGISALTHVWLPSDPSPRSIAIKYACGALGRASCIHARLRRLAMKLVRNAG